MRKIFVFMIMMVTGIIAQNDPVLKIKFIAKDLGKYSRDMYIGIDPAATDGLDRDLGESELPPLPPSGSYDVRFIFPDGILSSYYDYRQGDGEFSGTHVHKVSWQLSSGSQGFGLSWNLPDGMSMVVTDQLGGVVINNTYGSGENSIIVTNVNINRLILNVTYDHVNSVADHEMPESMRLEQNYPNPFNSMTNINYLVDAESMVRIVLYDTLGSEIAVLYEGEQNPGSYNLRVDAARYGLAAGIYYYVMEAISNNGGQDFRDTKKIIYLK